MADLYKTSQQAGSEVRRRGKGISTGKYKPGDFVQKETGQEYVPGRIASEAIGEDYRPGVLADRALQEPFPSPRRRGIEPPSGAASPSPSETPAQAQARIDSFLDKWEKSTGLKETAPPPQVSSRPLEGDFFGDSAKDLAAGGVQIVKGVYEIGNLVSGGALDEAIKSRTGRTGTENLAEGVQQIRESQSPALQAQRKELEDAKGFVDSFSTVLSNPRLAGSMLVEMVPQLATVGLAARAAAVRSIEYALSRGLSMEAASTMATTNATRVAIGANAVMEGTAAGSDARQSILSMKQEDLDKSPQYQKLLKELGDPGLARLKLANDASVVSTALATSISALLGKVTGAGALEARVLGQVTDISERAVAQAGKKGVVRRAGEGFLKESAQESGEEGGSTFSSNVGARVSGARPEQDLLEGVPEAAGAAAAVGGISGGFMGALDTNKGARKPGDSESEPGKSGIEAPPPGQDFRPNLTAVEMVSAVRDQGLMAYMYSVADDETKARLRAANPNLDLDQLSKDVDLVNAGKRIATQAPGFVGQVAAQLEGFDYDAALAEAEATPSAGGISGVTRANELAKTAADERAQGITDEKIQQAETGQTTPPVVTPRREPLSQEDQDIRIRGYQRLVRNLSVYPENYRVERAAQIVRDMLDQGFPSELVSATVAPILEPTTLDRATEWQRLRDQYLQGGQETETEFDAEAADLDALDAEMTEAESQLGTNEVDLPPVPIEPAVVQGPTSAEVDITPTEEPVAAEPETPMTFDEVRLAMARYDFGKSGNIEDMNENLYVETEVPPAFQAIAKAFGIKLYGVKYLGDNTRAQNRQGISLGRGTIALNFANPKKRNQLHILGHELYHELRRRNPEAALQLEQEVMQFLNYPAAEDFKAKLRQVGYDPADIDNEMVADLMGLLFTDKAFWEQVGQNNPTLLERIIRVLDDLIARFNEKGLREFMAQDMVADLDSLRTLLVKFVDLHKNEAAGNLDIAQSVDFDPDQNQALIKIRGLIREGKTLEASKIFKEQGFFREYGLKFNEVVADEEAKLAQAEPSVESITPPVQEEPEVPFRRAQEEVDAENAYAATQQIFDLLRRDQVAQAAKVFRETNLAAFGENFVDLQKIIQAERTKRVSQAQFKTDEQKKLALTSKRRGYDKRVDKLMSGVSKKIEEQIAQRKATAIAEAKEAKRMAAEKKAAEIGGMEEERGILDNDVGGVFTQMAVAGMYGGSEAQIQAQAKLEAMQGERQVDERGQEIGYKTKADMLVEENAAIMSGRVRTLVYTADRNLAELTKIREEMAKEGYDPYLIEQTVGKAERQLRELRDQELGDLVRSQLKDTANAVDAMKVSKAEPEIYPALEGIQAELDLNDEQRTDARRLAEAVANKEMTFAEAVRNIRENDIGLKHLYDQMRSLGMVIKKEYIDMSGNVSVNHKLNDWVKKFPSSAMWARHAWFKSYEALPVKGLVQLTPGEQASYDNWFKKMRELRTRRFEQEPGKGLSFMSLEQAFPNALFMNYTLNEMRNPDRMNPEDAVFIKEIAEDPVRSWMLDIKSAIQARPDLEPQLSQYLTADEMAAWQEFRAREFRESQRNIEMRLRSPIYSQLDSLRYLSPEVYMHYRTEIATAEEAQLAKILQNAFEVNELAREAIESGEDVGQTIGELMDERAQEDERSSVSADAMDLEAKYDTDGNEIVPDESITFERIENSGAMPGMNINEALEAAFAKWDVPPQYTVVQNLNQLPDDVRARLTQRFGATGFQGALDPKTGHIYILSDFHTNPDDAKFTMFHELYGHWGLRAFLGDKLDDFLNTQYRLNKKVREATDALKAEAEKMGQPMSQSEAIEEAISDMAAAGDTGAFHTLIGKLIRWLKAHGFENVAKWMDGSGDVELATVLQGARDAARNQGISPLAGAPMEVMYNRAKDQPVEAYAYRDGNITAYARMNPVTGRWTVFTINPGANSIIDGDYNITDADTLQVAHDILKQKGTVKVAKARETLAYISPDQVVKIASPLQDNPSTWNRFKRWVVTGAQNQFLPIFEVASQLARAGKDITVIDDLIKYEARTGYFIQDYQRRILNPIMKSLRKLGEMNLSIEDVDLFLMARHAAERNEMIKAVTSGKNKKGSGMTTAEAKAALKKFDANPEALAELRKIAALTDQLSKDKLAYMLQNGMITKFQFESLRNGYKHYVNLSGNKETDLDRYDGSQLGGRAFNVRGSDVIRSTGRGTQAVDVLQNTLNAYVATVIRGQKNRVLNSILNMFEQNPDKTYVEVNPIDTMKRINVDRFNFDNKVLAALGTDKPTQQAGRNFLVGLKQMMERGEITSDDALAAVVERIRLAEERRDLQPDEAARAIRNLNEQVVIEARLSPDGYVTTVETQARNPQSVTVKVNGRSVEMVFNNRSGDFFQAITGMNVQKTNAFFEALGAWSRFFSQMVTTWNPAWIPINVMRDVQTAIANMAADPEVGAELAGKMLKEYKKSTALAFRYMVKDYAGAKDGRFRDWLDKITTKHPLSAEDAKLIDEFYQDGGATYFLDRDSLDLTLEKLNKAMKKDSGVVGWTKDKLDSFTSTMDLLSMPTEIAPRLAVYKALREAGKSREFAARYAKELTVNFNLKGSSRELRAAYVFFNPAIQGTVRMFKDFKSGNYGRFAMVAGFWMGMGMLTRMAARAFGDDDDDDRPGVDEIDMISGYKKNTSLTWLPGVVGGSIPVAYGWNVFSAAGQNMYDVITGRMPVGHAAMETMKAAFDAFSPIGSGAESKTVTGQIVKTITPSAFMPVAELAMNENRFGAPIFREQSPFSNVSEANAYMHFNSVNPISKWSMQRLAEIGAGGRNARYRPGMIDVNPGAVDHLINSYLPGVFSEVYKASGLAITKAQGYDVSKEQPVPLLGRFKAEVQEDKFDQAADRRLREKVDTLWKAWEARDTTPAERADILKEYPQLPRLKALLKSQENFIKQNRQFLNNFERSPGISEQAKVEQRNRIMALEKKYRKDSVELALKSGFRDVIVGNE